MADTVAETPVPADEGGSLADHEQSFAPGAAVAQEPTPDPSPEPEPEPEPESKPAAERNDKGQFKPRHRAKSQQATPEDVPRIQELTRRLRETEAALEQARASRTTREPAPEPAPTPVATGPKFPTADQWFAQAENAGKEWDDYFDARANFVYEQRRAVERAEEASASAAKTHQEAVDAYVAKLDALGDTYPDFEEKVGAFNADSGRVSKAVEVACLQVGPDAAYYLATHPDELDSLTADSLIDPQNPAFGATVAMLRRYLSTLVASTQRTASRAAAGTPGSALALVHPVLPKPPNPGRTTAMKNADELPGDESSLAEHERAFAPKRRA